MTDNDAAETLDMVASYIIRRLADPSTVIETDQRELLERCVRERLSEGDFIRLLALAYGNPFITEFVDQALLRCPHPAPPAHAEFQRRLLGAVLSHQPGPRAGALPPPRRAAICLGQGASHS
jgi:hypothetical protein